MRRRLSVGYVSPFPPVRSGIADFSSELFPAIAALVDAVAYSPAEAKKSFASGHDAVLVQIGNDPLHAPTYEALTDESRTTPAVVTLHDFSLHHLFVAAYFDRGREEDYERELVRNHGEKGRALWTRMKQGLKLPVWDLEPWSFPMSTEVARRAAILVVHSRLVAGCVLRAAPGVDVVEFPHHVVPAPRTLRDEARRVLGLPLDRPVAVTLGILTPAKRVLTVLKALAALPPPSRPFLFVGGAGGDDDPHRIAARDLGLQDDVGFGGYLSEEDFWRAASAADFAVNLRHPTVGEASGAVCRLAGFGLPVIVSDAGWFRELPDSFAVKIPVGAGEVEAIAAALARLAFDPPAAKVLGDAAATWGRGRRPDRVAEGYARVLREAAEGRGRIRAVSGRLALEMSLLGIGRPGMLDATSRVPDAEVVGTLSARLEGLVPARPVLSFD